MRHGLPCRASQDAGRYLCNASYFAALAGPVPVLFLHIPKPPGRRPAGKTVERTRRRTAGRSGKGPAKPRPARSRPVRARAGWHERLAAAFADVGIDLLAAARRRRPRPSRPARPGLGPEPEGSLTPRS
jgi:pyroglutamyl-peptidase